MPVDLSSMNVKGPPRKSETPRRGRPPASNKKDARTEAVIGVFQLVQFACVTTGNHADAAAIGMHAENISHEIVNLADVNEGIAKAIDYLLTVGPYAALVTACLPLVLQVAANHGRVPPNTPGVIPTELLEARFKADMLAQKAELERQAQEAREAIARMQADEHAQSNGQVGQEAAQGHTGAYL